MNKRNHKLEFRFPKDRNSKILLAKNYQNQSKTNTLNRKQFYPITVAKSKSNSNT